MKKLISLTLSMLMLFSCFSVLTAGALDAGDIADAVYSEESIAASKAALSNFKVKNLPDNFNCDIRELPSWTDNDPDNDVSLIGMDLDYLYNCEGSFIWSFFDVFAKDENGNTITVDGSPVLKITTDDLELAFANVNVYLQKVFYGIYGGLNLHTVENAVNISNFIGRIIRPDYVELDADNFKDLFGNKVPTSNEFYNTVSTLSGLSEVIEYNWIVRDYRFYKPVIDALGGTYTEFYEDYYNDPVKLGAKMIEGAINKICTVGPIEFVLDFLSYYCANYNNVYREPTLALLRFKTDIYNSVIPTEEINSFNGLLQLLLCDCDPLNTTIGICFNGAKVNHFVPVEFPIDRFTRAADSVEKMIYLFYYLNLCGRFGNNREVVNNWKAKINASSRLSAADKTRVGYLLDGFILGDFDKAVDNVIIPIYKENVTTAPDSLFDRFRNTMMGFLKKIADYFDYLRKLFSGEIKYGQGNSPFN